MASLQRERNRRNTCSDCSDDTKCGFWMFDCNSMQKLASKKVYVVLFGLSGFIHYSLGGYMGGTLSTIEKNFKISSTNVGVILAGFDIAAMFTAIFLCYSASKMHRTRIMAFAMLIFAVGCFLYGSVFLIYGPGQDALALTQEYGLHSVARSSEIIGREHLCDKNKPVETCNSDNSDDGGNLIPQVMFFCGLALAAIGDILFGTIGITYLDDNVSKAKSPFLVSLANFIRMLGPSFGFLLASYSLRIYVAPGLHPTIDDADPRWIGAWWLGWFIIGLASLLGSFLFVLFPRTLPRAAARMKTDREAPTRATFEEFKATAARLFNNKTFMFNLFAGVFYTFGRNPFYKYQSKYLEVQYKVSSSTAAMITGSVSLVFFSVGLLTSGAVISKFKPSARSLAAWNVVTSLSMAIAICTFSFIGCGSKPNLEIVGDSTTLSTCNLNCMCDFTPYSPVCGANNMSYLSACHAGCTEENTGGTTYQNCSCIEGLDASAATGVCPVDCQTSLMYFLVVLCAIKFLAGTEGTANFMIEMRCVETKDKIIVLAISEVAIDLFALFPSPILFGYIIDSTCVLFGKSCSGEGNCWLYNEEQMRYWLNLTAAGFILIGTILDVGTWWHSENVQIFDDDDEESSKVDGVEVKELKSLVE